MLPTSFNGLDGGVLANANSTNYKLSINFRECFLHHNAERTEKLIDNTIQFVSNPMLSDDELDFTLRNRQVFSISTLRRILGDVYRRFPVEDNDDHLHPFSPTNLARRDERRRARALARESGRSYVVDAHDEDEDPEIAPHEAPESWIVEDTALLSDGNLDLWPPSTPADDPTMWTEYDWTRLGKQINHNANDETCWPSDNVRWPRPRHPQVFSYNPRDDHIHVVPFSATHAPVLLPCGHRTDFFSSAWKTQCEDLDLVARNRMPMCMQCVKEWQTTGFGGLHQSKQRLKMLRPLQVNETQEAEARRHREHTQRLLAAQRYRGCGCHFWRAHAHWLPENDWDMFRVSGGVQGESDDGCSWPGGTPDRRSRKLLAGRVMQHTTPGGVVCMWPGSQMTQDVEGVSNGRLCKELPLFCYNCELRLVYFVAIREAEKTLGVRLMRLYVRESFGKGWSRAKKVALVARALIIMKEVFAQYLTFRRKMQRFCVLKRDIMVGVYCVQYGGARQFKYFTTLAQATRDVVEVDQ